MFNNIIAAVARVPYVAVSSLAKVFHTPDK